MKRLFFFGIILIVPLVALGVWFWSLGSLPAVSASNIVLHIEHTGVEVKAVGGEKWEAATEGMVLKESDEVRTDISGRATIRFFETGETRLQENSSVVIEKAEEVADQPTTVLIELKLISGKVWSRVLRLLDLDSSFSVRTDTVVATVRGTAFEMSQEEDGTTVRVFESAVEVGSENAEGDTVSEGFKLSREKGGAWKTVERFGAQEETSEWYKENLKADEAYLDLVKAGIAKRLSSRPVSRPDHPLYGLARASELLHLAVSGKKGSENFGRYLEYRFYGIKALVDDGKSGLAFQAMTELDQDINKRLKEKKGADDVKFMRRAEAKVRVLFEGEGPDSTLYRLKQRMEDEVQEMSRSDKASELFERISASDARLHEAAALLNAGKLDEVQATLEAAKQGLANIGRDLEGVTDITPNRMKVLRGKVKALLIREAAISSRLKNSLLIPGVTPENATTTTSIIKQPLISTTTTSTIKPPLVSTSTTILQKPPTAPMLDFISLIAFPNPVEVGQLSRLRVMGLLSDGSKVDVTARATFVIIGNLGIISGAAYSAARPGSVIIEAVVFENGQKKIAKIPLTIIEPPTAPIDTTPIDTTSNTSTVRQ